MHFPRGCYKELHVTFCSQEVLRGLSSLFMRTTGVVSMLGSSPLGLSTRQRWFYSMMSSWMLQLAANLSVSKWGLRHNHMDQPWEETMWYCVLSVCESICSLSAIFISLKKNTCGQRHGSLNSRILSQLNSEIQLYQYKGRFPQTLAFPLITQRPLENQIWLL